jgi:hypothetical protein
MAEPDSTTAQLTLSFKVFHHRGTDASVPGTRNDADEIEFAVLVKN